MTADPQTPPHTRLLHTAREYLTHWFTAGVILTLTGFTPDHWVERLFHAANLDSLLAALPAMDYRLIAVGAGVALTTGSALFRIWRAPVIAPAAAPVVADALATEALEAVTGKPSIAVLPFVNMSDDKSQEYFADGITEDITTGLSCDSRLFVVSRNSAFVYKGKPVDSRTVGKELGVRYVLEGSIRPMGERLRITAQLIDTATGNHVWADKIDRPTAEIFAISDEVVNGLVMALASNLSAAEGKRAARAKPEDLQAWVLCVQVESQYASRTGTEAFVAAEKLLRRAAEIEPAYAMSWALLAYIAGMRVLEGLSADPAKDADEALELANRSMRLAPHDPAVLGYCGWAYAHIGHAAQAIDCLEHSLELNPCGGVAQIAYGLALLNAGRPGESITQLDVFLRLSPKDPLAYLAYGFRAYCFLVLGDFQPAEQSARNSIKLNPANGGVYFPLAYALAALGHMDEARQQIRKSMELTPELTRQAMEDYYLRTQTPRQAKGVITALRRVWPD